MCSQMSFLDTSAFICSPVSPAGNMHSSSQGGRKGARYGLGVARASRSASPGRAKEQQIAAISGPKCEDSSPSAALGRSLESRLRLALDVNGSLEYVLTWKHWDMQSGPPICALRARAHPTSDSVSTGWPTPDTGLNTVDANWQERRARIKAEKKNGNGFGLTLGMAATLSGWPTPNAIPESRGGLQTNPEKALERRAQGHMLNLDDAATLAGWATPTTRDHKDGASMLENTPINSLLGRQVSLSSVPMEKRGALNPDFSRWLMGFSHIWGIFAPLKSELGKR